MKEPLRIEDLRPMSEKDPIAYFTALAASTMLWEMENSLIRDIIEQGDEGCNEMS